MILRLRLQFVAISMTLVALIFFGIFGLLHTLAANNLEQTSLAVLERVIDEDGAKPQFDIAGTRIELPYFTVSIFGQDSAYTAYVTGGTYDNLENTAILSDILTLTLAQGDTQGILSEYNLRYLRTNTGFVNRFAFVDTTMEQVALESMLTSFSQILVLAFLLLVVLSWFLSGLAVRPVAKAWQQQRQFLSDASHELKTPLTVILSNAQLLDSAPLDTAPSRWVDNIHYEAQVMKTLVEQMLTLARADQSLQKTQLLAVSLWDIATDCVLLFEPTAFEAGKPLQESLCPDVMVLGDGEKLRQLLSILLDNAIKYGADGAPIFITLTHTEKVAKLVVENQGTPIPSEQLPHLFERFYRSDASRGEQSGFGLGLAIAATIAKEHKATLRVQSDVQSTRFLFTIPLKKGH